MTTISSAIVELASRASQAAAILRDLERDVKDKALLEGAKLLRAGLAELEAANAKDLATAKHMGLSAAAIDRLILDKKRVDVMAAALEEVAALPDPVGEVSRGWRRPNGLQVERVRIPLGVILIIYESRPNVTSDAASLCLKSGNAVILRGGKESLHSNIAIGNILRRACQQAGVPPDAIVVVDNTDRDSIYQLLQLEEQIDLVIPRGGEELIRAVAEKSRIPVLKHYKGVCHVYIDRDADLAMAKKIVLNAKVQRPGVCNAMETLLIDRAIAKTALPQLCQALRSAGVTLKGDAEARALDNQLAVAEEADFYREYLDLVANVAVVDGVTGAAAHIEKYGSEHTEAIVTQNWQTARRFIRLVDSSTVAVNASTRFADGNQLGLGAEIGISTTKLHAFGPMGLEELTAQKFVVMGDGQIRQ